MRYRGYSRLAIKWLDEISEKQNIFIQHAENGGEVWLKGIRGHFKPVDGFCKESNTAYQSHGDKFHGNPLVYDIEECPNPHKPNTPAPLLYFRTKAWDFELRMTGFNVVTMWEYDYLRRLQARRTGASDQIKQAEVML